MEPIPTIRFNNTNLLFNEQKTINERIAIKISYLTAFLYIDGTQITSFYPKVLTPDCIIEDISETCREHGIELSSAESKAIADYMISQMPT